MTALGCGLLFFPNSDGGAEVSPGPGGGAGVEYLLESVLVSQQASLPQLLLDDEPLVPGQVRLAPGVDVEQRGQDGGVCRAE